CEEDTSLGCMIFTHTVAQELILASGKTHALMIKKEDQIEQSLIAFQIYENPFEMKPMTRAVKDSDGFYISGSLKYVVAGHLKGKAIIPAILNNDNIAFFLIDLSEKSIHSSPPILSLGLHACGAIDIELNKTRGILLGSEKNGKKYYSRLTEKMSLAAAAMSLGIMKGSLKEAINYSKIRSQGGKKIIDWSELKMILANMAIQVKTSEMLIDRACQAVDQKERNSFDCVRATTITVQSSACKLTTDGIQILGGVGYMKDFGQEKRYRDAHQIQSIFGLLPLKKLQYINLLLKKD
ncbi:acyl-CoA dehydrogenase, partial [Candidatus Magnetomorum sp. HK-1]